MEPHTIMMRFVQLLLMFLHLSGVAAQTPFALCYDDQASGALTPWIPMITQGPSNELLIAWPRSAPFSDSLNVLHVTVDGQPINAYQLRRAGSDLRIDGTIVGPDGPIIHAGSANDGHLLLRTSPLGEPLSGISYTVGNGVSATMPNVVRSLGDGNVISSWSHLDGSNGQGSIVMSTDASGGINWVIKVRVDDEPTDLRTIVPLADNKLLLVGAIGSIVDGINTVHSAMVVMNDQGDVLWAQRLQADNAEHITLMGAMQLPDGTLLVGGSHALGFGDPANPIVLAFDADGSFLWGTEYLPASPSQYHLGPTQVLAEGDSAMAFLGLSLGATNVFLLRANADGQVIAAYEQPMGTYNAVARPINGIYYTQRDASSSGISIPCLYHPDGNGATCELPAVTMTTAPFVPNVHPGWLPIAVDVGAEDITDQFQVLPRPLPLANDVCNGLPTMTTELVPTTITLSPNPAGTVVRIHGAPIYRVIVMDACGLCVMDRTFSPGPSIEFSVEELRPGMYLAHLHGTAGQHVRRFMKE